MLQSYTERLQARLQELLGASPDRERVLQEALFWSTAAISRRKSFASKTTFSIFWACSTHKASWQETRLPAARNEPRGKYFALEDLRTGGRGIKNYRAGLSMKAEIEKSREQVQNLE